MDKLVNEAYWGGAIAETTRGGTPCEGRRAGGVKTVDPWRRNWCQP
jgi:hypothetical protein